MKIEQVGVACLPNPGEEPPKWSERPRGGRDVRWCSAAVRILWPAGAAQLMHSGEKPPGRGEQLILKRWEAGERAQKKKERKIGELINN